MNTRNPQDDTPPLSLSPDEIKLLSTSPRSRSESTLAKLMKKLVEVEMIELRRLRSEAERELERAEAIPVPEVSPEANQAPAPKSSISLPSSGFKFQASDDHVCLFGFDEEFEEERLQPSM